MISQCISPTNSYLDFLIRNFNWREILANKPVHEPYDLWSN